MKTEQLLPKNIRQIGSPVGHTKVYIEDYVITFFEFIINGQEYLCKRSHFIWRKGNGRKRYYYLCKGSN